MKSFNQAILIGHVAAEPEVKSVPTKNGDVKMAKFTLATSTGGYTKKDGTQVPENTQFHRIVAWRGDAEYIEKYIHKGDGVTVTGEIDYSEVVIGADGKINKDTNAQGTKVRFTDIIADEVILCHSKNGIQRQPQQAAPQGQQFQQQPYYPQYPQQGYAQQQFQQQFQPAMPQQPYQQGGYNPQNNGNAPF